jgi:hypothetical protein
VDGRAAAARAVGVGHERLFDGLVPAVAIVVHAAHLR